jgi:NADH-quinone oxidoreductase subunit C
MLQFDQILAIVKRATTDDVVVDEASTPKIIVVSPKSLKNVCLKLFNDADAFFDMLSCITAIDNGPQINTMEIVYNLYSIPFNHHVALKIILSREKPEAESLVDIWRTANWHEREAFDMFGIIFHGHPDLRRILMPADWEGHPLRKDYQQQQYYRDIKVEY